jgi:hypothetical protein
MKLWIPKSIEQCDEIYKCDMNVTHKCRVQWTTDQLPCIKSVQIYISDKLLTGRIRNVLL